MHRGSGTASLSPVIQRLAKVESEIDETSALAKKAASELAIMRLKDEIKAIETELNQTKQTRTEVYVSGFLGLVVAAAGLSMITSGYWTVALFTCIIGGIFLAFSYFTIRGNSHRQRRLQRTLKEKQHELHLHQKIVKSLD